MQDFESIKAIKFYQPMVVRGLHAWPVLYTIILEQLKKCANANSYESMWKDMPGDTDYNCQIFDYIRTHLKDTGTFLEVIDGELTLNINKFVFKEDSDRTMSLYKLQWDEKSFNTFKNIKLPEFVDLIDRTNNEYISYKEYFNECRLFNNQESYFGKRLAITNKRRINGLLNIIEKIKYLYTDIYPEFINGIIEEQNKV